MSTREGCISWEGHIVSMYGAPTSESVSSCMGTLLHLEPACNPIHTASFRQASAPSRQELPILLH